MILGIAIYATANCLCPPEEMMSDVCEATWFQVVMLVNLCFSTALSAVLVVLAAFITATTNKNAVAWSAFGIGSVTAVWFAAATLAWIMLILLPATIAAGYLTARLLTGEVRPGIVKTDRRHPTDP